MKPLKKGEKVARYSTYANMALTLMKGIVGLLSGSLALIADAIHSLVDIFASLTVYIGLKLSQKKPGLFPYGYYRIETFVSLIISIIIIITGFEIGMESFSYILHPSKIMLPSLALLVTLISVFISYFFAVYKEKIGRKIKSQALVNDGRHSLLDVVSSMIVFFGMLFEYLGLRGFQGLAGIIIAILIIYLGLKFARYDILVLFDACIDQKSLQSLEKRCSGSRAWKESMMLGLEDRGLICSRNFILNSKEEHPLKK